MKKILVPTDLSPLANKALEVAATIARKTGAELTLLHYVPFLVVEDLMSYDIPATIVEYNEEQVTEARAVLESVGKLPAYEGLKITATVSQGVEGLYNVIAEQNADLIVIASHGASGLQEFLWGSNAENVANQARCPVLIVKENTHELTTQNPVCAIDIDPQIKINAPLPLENLNLRQFVYVITPTDNRVPDGIREWMSEWATIQNLTDYTFTVYADRTVPEGIITYANEAKADLIVLYTHQKSGLLSFLGANVVEKVINHSPLPVLVIPVY